MGALIIALALLSQASKDEVAKASERIEKARSNLQAAIAKIEKKDPSDADFAAARAALEPLKAALDAGNALEAEDLGYARLALEARKELRAKRERIDQRMVELKLDIMREGIEQAVADLEAALSRIQGKEAADDQFEAARKAADELAKALDRGRPLVGSDPEYTAYFGTVTKKLDLQRREIESRHVAVGVDRHRAKVEDAERAFDAAAAAKELGEDQYAKVKAAAAAVTKLLEAGKRLELDKSYAAYAAKTKQKIAASIQKIDERRTEAASAKQKVEIDAMRKGLAEAVAALKSRDPSDELFTEAEKSADIVRRMLDAADALPAKSRSFAQYLVEARRSLAATEAQIAERQQAVKVPRHRRKVEEARRVLTDALSALRGNDVPENSFTAAENAAANLEKILEDGAILEKRDRQYQTYAREVRKRIAESRERIAVRRDELAVAKMRAEVQGAWSALAGAIKRLSTDNPSEGEFAEARTAATVVEKTIEAAAPTKAKDARFASYLADMKKSVQSSRDAIDRRELEVDVGHQRTRVESELEKLEGALSSLEMSPNEAGFENAAEAAAKVESALAAGGELAERHARYATWAAQAKKRLAQLNQRIAARRLETDVFSASERIETRLGTARTSIATAMNDTSTDQTIKQATAAMNAIRDELAKAAPLEQRDKSYAKLASSAKEQVQALSQELEQASHLLSFRKGPIDALAQGLAQSEAASRAQGLEPQRDAWAQALSRFQACRTQSADLIGDHPKIATVEVSAGQARMQAKDVIGLCGEHAEKAEEQLAHVKAILAVYEGPARSFEQAKSILAKAEKAKDQEKKSALSQALTHLESCLEKGKILQYKHPKLAEMQFDVAGGKLTLSAVVADCQQRAKAIRASL